ncbi:MAG: SEL1-like repeat protein [Sedimenticola sp.]
MKKVHSVILMLLLLPVVAAADFSSAMDAYEQRDFRTASAEFEVLANQNDADAQFMLGYMYAVGEGILQDYIKAHKWFNLAASQGKEGASNAREKVAARMTPQQVAKAQRLARNWKPQTSEQDDIQDSPGSAQTSEVYTPSRETVIAVQRRLNELGYDPGPADGAPGKRTRRAIREYQLDKGLTVDGGISRELVDSLNAASVSDAGMELRYPEVWEVPAEERDSQTEAFLGELRELVAKAEKQRAADRWLIRDLNALIKEEVRPWPTQVLHESFSDRDYQWNHIWRLTSGRTELERGVGLRCIVDTGRAGKDSSRSDSVRGLFGSLLGIDKSSSRENGLAEISARESVSNSFALRVKVSAVREGTHLVIKLNQDDQRKIGYHLEFIPGRRGGVELLRADGSRRSLIQSYDRQVNLADGQLHTIEWLRQDNGEMAVALDGNELFRVTDTEFLDSFKGVSFTNFGDDYILNEVVLLGAGES